MGTELAAQLAGGFRPGPSLSTRTSYQVAPGDQLTDGLFGEASILRFQIAAVRL